MLHPIGLAINKLVALANRSEPRDVLDAIFADSHMPSLAALVWAVAEKNPGLDPSSYLQRFRRRMLAPEDATYLRFTGAHSVENAARRMISAADAFIAANTCCVPGARLQDRRTGLFFLTQSEDDWTHTREHRGALGGVVAQPADLHIGEPGLRSYHVAGIGRPTSGTIVPCPDHAAVLGAERFVQTVKTMVARQHSFIRSESLSAQGF